MSSSTQWLRRVLGAQPFRFADVGAARGIPSHLTVLSEVADLMLFEPNPQEAQALSVHYQSANGASRVRVYPCALSGTGGKRTLHVTNVPTGSSLLRPSPRQALATGDEGYFFPMREIEVDTRTLSDVLQEAQVGSLDFIKLDIQGAELEVLQGAGQAYLEKLTAVELEIGMPGCYEEQARFSDIDQFLRSHQLDLFDIKPARGHRARKGDASFYPIKVFNVHPESPALPKRVWEVDAIYFRDPTQMLERKDADGVRRLVAMMCVYGFFQEALHVAELAGEQSAMSAEDAGLLRENIVAWHRATEYCVIYLPWLFPILRRLQRALRRIACGRRRDRWAQT